MSALATWLIAIIGPLVVRGVIALGFTIVTFTGVTELIAGMVSLAQNSWAAMPEPQHQKKTQKKNPEVLGLIFGAYAARVAMWAALGASRYVTKSP